MSVKLITKPNEKIDIAEYHTIKDGLGRLLPSEPVYKQSNCSPPGGIGIFDDSATFEDLATYAIDGLQIIVKETTVTDFDKPNDYRLEIIIHPNVESARSFARRVLDLSDKFEEVEL